MGSVISYIRNGTTSEKGAGRVRMRRKEEERALLRQNKKRCTGGRVFQKGRWLKKRNKRTKSMAETICACTAAFVLCPPPPARSRQKVSFATSKQFAQKVNYRRANLVRGRGFLAASFLPILSWQRAEASYREVYLRFRIGSSLKWNGKREPDTRRPVLEQVRFRWKIRDRWRGLCGDVTALYNMLHWKR